MSPKYHSQYTSGKQGENKKIILQSTVIVAVATVGQPTSHSTVRNDLHTGQHVKTKCTVHIVPVKPCRRAQITQRSIIHCEWWPSSMHIVYTDTVLYSGTVCRCSPMVAHVWNYKEFHIFFSIVDTTAPGNLYCTVLCCTSITLYGCFPSPLSFMQIFTFRHSVHIDTRRRRYSIRSLGTIKLAIRYGSTYSSTRMLID